MSYDIFKGKDESREMNRLRAYITIESTSALLLFLGTVFALFISNTNLNDEYLRLINLPISISIGELMLSKPLIKWVNDGLMAPHIRGHSWDSWRQKTVTTLYKQQQRILDNKLILLR